MARRRADKRPGLFGRVRWANLGRSAALLAAGLIVLTRGCGGPGDAPAARIPAGPLAPPAAVAPAASDRGPLGSDLPLGPDPPPHKRPRAHRPRHRHDRAHFRDRRPARAAPSPPRPAPIPRWSPPPLPEWGP